MEEFIWISIQTRKRLLGIEIVVGLLGSFLKGGIAIAGGAPEGGVRIVRHAVKSPIE